MVTHSQRGCALRCCLRQSGRGGFSHELLAQPKVAVEEAMIEAERMSQCGARRISIYESGVVYVTDSDTCGRSEVHLSTRRSTSLQSIARLRTVLNETTFASISPELVPPTVITDEDVLSISMRTKDGVR